MKKVDLHIHSDFSDGSDNIKNLTENIKNANIEIFSLTDHDTIDGCKEIKKFIPKEIEFISGIELTCQIEDIKCHILGYNCNIENENLAALIQKGKILRRKKLDTRIEYLKNVLKIDLTKEELDWLYSRKSVVKTHLANILVNRKMAKTNVEAMEKYLDCIKTENTRFDGIEAINTIISSEGIPVWAHPLGGEGEIHLSSEKFLKKLDIMKNSGIKGLECYYSRYSFEEIEFLKDCAKNNHLFISGGSDYHGTNKENIPLAKLNCKNFYVNPQNLTILKILN